MNPQEPTEQPQPYTGPTVPGQSQNNSYPAEALVPGQPTVPPAPAQQPAVQPPPAVPSMPQPAAQPQPGTPAMPATPMNAPAGTYNPANPTASQESDKSYIAAVILSWIVGVFGADRFYLGYTGLGIAKLLTLGGLGFWAIIDFVLIALGKIKDKEGRTLGGYEKNKKIGLILLALYVLFYLYSLATLPAHLKQLQASTAAVSQSTQAVASVGGDQKRQNDIKALKSQLELYGLDRHQYPTFAQVNDPSFRKAYFIGIDPSGYTDPSGNSGQLVSTPQAGAYAYSPSPIGCDNVKVQCTSYVLTATLANGQAYTQQAIGF